MTRCGVQLIGVLPLTSLFELACQGKGFIFEQDLRKYGLAVAYVGAFAVISSAIYYIPNYAWLEYVTAYHSALVMQFLGIPARVEVTSAGVLLNEFVVEKPCTGIQVVATFTGVLLPLPKLTWPKKVLGLILVAGGVYFANIARIVIQLSIYYSGFWNWTLIHGPGGEVLGITSVTLLVVLLDRFVPEFGELVFSVLKR